jgi:hypothetical protein
MMQLSPYVLLTKICSELKLSGEDLMQSLAQTQMLLENVWVENYHDFGEFNPDNSAFNFPPSQDLFTRNVDLSTLTPPPPPPMVGMPMKFPDEIASSDANQTPPALPPKKNQG